MIETNSFEVSKANGKNNQHSAYNEVNNTITNQILDTSLENSHSKYSNDKNAEIMTDSLKSIEINSTSKYNSETNENSVDNKNEEKMALHPLENVDNSDQFMDLEYDLDSLILKNDNSDEENEAELHLGNVSAQLRQNSCPSKKAQCNDRQIKNKIKPDFGQSNSHEIISELNTPYYLPDILTSINKSKADGKIQKSDSLNSNTGSIPKSKSLLTQTSYIPNQLRSEVLQNEMETELKQLKTNLHSLQSIYKFAYDETVTDQSDTGSKSPSPLDPESNVPSSLTNAEILIHEADSGSDAGSEDVELIPHRYESETFLSDNKHVYVNRLSLAVELLRTQETLPYDDEFKRVTGENRISNNLEANEIIKTCFEEDLKNSKALVSQSQVNQTRCSSDKGENLVSDHIQEDTGIERRGNRKFGVHQYISQKAAVSMDPWICCIIM